MQRKKALGFTLLEVFIVVALIIALVSAAFYAEKRVTKLDFSLAKPVGPAIYYATISYTGANQTLSSYELYRKPQSGSPVQIATLPVNPNNTISDFVLLPDQSAIFLNYVTHLDRLDLSSHKQTTVYTAEKYLDAPVLSPDKTLLLLWDETNTGAFSVKTFDLKTGAIKKIGAGDLPSQNNYGWKVAEWTDNNTIVFDGVGADFVSEIWKYTISSQSFVKLGLFPVNTQTNGAIIAKPNDSQSGLSGLCQEPIHKASTYRLTNLVNGQDIGTIGIPNKEVNIIAFSPSGKQVLMSVSNLPVTKAECDTALPITYYLSTIDGSNLHEIGDYASVFASWKVPVLASVSVDMKNNRLWHVKEGNKTVFRPTLNNSDDELRIIGSAL